MGTAPVKPAKSKILRSIDPIINEDHVLVVEPCEYPWRFRAQLCYRAGLKTQTLAEATLDLSFTTVGDKITETLKLKPKGELQISLTLLTGTQFPQMSFQTQNLPYTPTMSFELGASVEITISQAVGLIAESRISTHVFFGTHLFGGKKANVRGVKNDNVKTKAVNGFNPFWGESAILTLTTNQDVISMTVVSAKQSKKAVRTATIEDTVIVPVGDLKDLSSPNGGIINRWFPLQTLGGMLGVSFKILSPKNSLLDLPDPQSVAFVSQSQDKKKETTVGFELSLESPLISSNPASTTPARPSHGVTSLDEDASWLPPKEPINSDLANLEQEYLKNISLIKDSYTQHVQQLDTELKERISKLEEELAQGVKQLKSEYKIKELEETNLFEVKSKAKQQLTEQELAELALNYQQQQEAITTKIQNMEKAALANVQQITQQEINQMKSLLHDFATELVQHKTKNSDETFDLPCETAPEALASESSEQQTPEEATPQRGKLLRRAPSFDSSRSNHVTSTSRPRPSQTPSPSTRGSGNARQAISELPRSKRATESDDPLRASTSPRDPEARSTFSRQAITKTQQPSDDSTTLKRPSVRTWAKHHVQADTTESNPEAHDLSPRQQTGIAATRMSNEKSEAALSPRPQEQTTTKPHPDGSQKSMVPRVSHRPTPKLQAGSQPRAPRSDAPTSPHGQSDSWLTRNSARPESDSHEELPSQRRKPDLSQPKGKKPGFDHAPAPRGWPPREKLDSGPEGQKSDEAPSSPKKEQLSLPSPSSSPTSPTENSSCVVCKQAAAPINLGGRNFCSRCAEIIKARANAKGIVLKQEP